MAPIDFRPAGEPTSPITLDDGADDGAGTHGEEGGEFRVLDAPGLFDPKGFGLDERRGDLFDLHPTELGAPEPDPGRHDAEEVRRVEAFLEPNGPGFTLDTGRGTALDVGLSFGALAKGTPFGTGSKLQSTGKSAVKHDQVGLNWKYRGGDGEVLGQVYNSGEGVFGGNYVGLGPVSVYAPVDRLLLDPDGRELELTHDHVGLKTKLWPEAVDRWTSRLPGKAELSFESILGLGAGELREADGEVDSRTFGLTAGGKVKLSDGWTSGGDRGSLKFEIVSDYQSHLFAGVTLDPETPEALAPLNRGDTDLARLDLDNLHGKFGTDGVLSQFTNQRHLSPDGRVLNHGSPVAGQIQHALGVLGRTEIDGRPLFAWEDHSTERPPTEADLRRAIDRAVVEGGVAPEAFAGRGGLNFGRSDIAAANLAVHGVDRAQRSPLAGDYLYTPLPEHHRFTDAGTIRNMSAALFDREIPAAHFEIGRPVERGEFVFPGAAEVGARAAHDLGAAGGRLVLDAGGAAQRAYEGALGSLDDGLRHAEDTFERFGRRAREVAGETIERTPGTVIEGIERGGERLEEFARDVGQAFRGVPHHLGEALAESERLVEKGVRRLLGTGGVDDP